MFPVSIGMVAILANYLGSPLKFMDTQTTWSLPIIDQWDDCPEFSFNPENEWWKKTKVLLQEAASRAPRRYFVGIPDLNGPSEILSRLRDPSNLCLDIIENPSQVGEAIDEITRAWLRYWEACHGIIHQCIGGYINWMGIWSESPFTDLQSDSSCLISPKDFNELILPSIEQQTEWIGRTMYHLDGPDAIRHLDSLLSLPKLSGIQWIPGAGSPPMSEWIPLLKRIQKAGKLQHLICQKGEVRKLLRELEPEDDYLLWQLGDIYLQSGKYQKALEIGKYHYKIHPESPNIVQNLLSVLEKLGKPVEEFPWKGNPKILKIEDALDIVHKYILLKKGRKKKIHLLNLYYEPFHNKGLFLGFSIDRFEERIRNDRRFVVSIEGDVSLSSP